MKASNQLELENQNLDIVIKKTMSEIDKASTNRSVYDLKQSRNVIPYYVTELENRLNQYLAETLLGIAKVKPVPAKVMTLVSPLIISHFTVKSIINHIGAKNINAHAMYTLIAKQLELEYNMGEIKTSNKEKYSQFVGYLKNSTYTGNRLHKITADLMHKYHQDVISSNLTTSFLQVSQLAVYALAECQPIVNGSILPSLIHIGTIKDNTTKGDKPRSKVKIIPADWLLEWIRTQTLEGNMISAYNTALIEPPKPWSSLTKGGFHSPRLANSFIKTSVDIGDFSFNEMKDTVDAVNNLQNTAWEINTDLLEIMQYAFVNRLNWGKLPSPIEIASVPYPFPDLKRADLNEDQLAIVKAWASHKCLQHDEFHSEVSRYLTLNRVLNEAKRFKEYDRLYFAYQVDFRGRIYPMAANLHPQGAKFVKPLLRFAEGKVINTELAKKYLALQGANTYGKDKLRLDEKYIWVMANESKIFKSAQDPITEEFWKTADEPWSFLAFCFEWKAYRQNPLTFLSKLPVALDGSCNGLQHLSAMMRDEVGGKEVNLTANYNKEDIYTAVKKVTDKKLLEDGSDLAKRLLSFGIDRSTCKRPVMIVPYAGTQSACRQYISDDFEERGGRSEFGTDFDSALSLATSVVWGAIGDVVLKGREVMTWFKKAAREAIKASEGASLSWVTPNGFKVVQKRVKMREELHQTSLGERIPVRLSFRLKVETDLVDISGHTSAVSPNFIHSLDACALQNTVLMASKSGVNSLAMIHDSYGTHAADTEKLAYFIRKSFFDIYNENDVLAQWILSQPIAAQAKFPELPTKGSLDLNEVFNSEHFFA